MGPPTGVPRKTCFLPFLHSLDQYANHLTQLDCLYRAPSCEDPSYQPSAKGFLDSPGWLEEVPERLLI